jgi:RNA polymerase sigma-70 factor (ECF subfamily)
METSVSLLERLRTAPDEEAWKRLDDLYRPLIHRWVLRDPKLRGEAEDLVQEVMQVLVRELPGFRRERNGSFRRWLRSVTVYRILATYRAKHRRPVALGAAPEECPLAELNDPNSELSRLWDQEHDQYVLRRLLELVEPLFEPTTLTAFRRVVFDDIAAKDAALELGLSVNAVCLAKSRVLNRLRQEAAELID